MPRPDLLKAIREEIYHHPDDFLKIINNPAFKSRFSFFDDDKLKTAPQGYPKDWEHIDLLRYKSYAPYRMIGEEELFSSDLLENIINDLRLMQTFNQFLYDAIGYE
jgi:uncharacterized protein (TIGR02453 family)